MLTEDTTGAILVMEQVDGTRSGALQAALGELCQLTRKHLGGQAEMHVLKGSASIEMVP